MIRSILQASFRRLCLYTRALATGVIVLGVLTNRSLADSREDVLRAFFEGRKIAVTLDMPATYKGIDLYPRRQPALNFDEYQKRIKTDGISIPARNCAVITKIKLKSDLIEVHLDGGGFEDGGNEVDWRFSSAAFDLEGRKRSFPKSHADSMWNDNIDVQIARLQAQRDSAASANQATSREHAKSAGSRFNLRYDKGAMPQPLTGEVVMAALSKYVVFSGFGRATPFAPKYSDDFRRTIVRISSKWVGAEESGSGMVFMIVPNKAFVLTANHVVTDGDGFAAKKINVEFIGDTQTYSGALYCSYKEFDVAVLSLDRFPEGVGMVKLGESVHARIGDGVCIFGYPGGGGHTRDDGKISRLASNRIYLDDIDPVEGNSGGPLLDKKGEVIGMILQKSASKDNQYALEVTQIRLLLGKESVFSPLFTAESIPPCLE